MNYLSYFPNNTTHRQFRLNMAAAAVRSDNSTRTLKFPLEQPENGWPFSPDDSNQLFNTTEGVGKGTLVGFLFAALVSGFRAFSKGGETQLFRCQSKLPMEQFEKDFQAVFNRKSNDFTPLGLLNYFSTEKRTHNKNKTLLTPAMLAGELYRLSAKCLPEKDKKLDSKFLEACEFISGLICQDVKAWKDLQDSVMTALKAVDTAFATLSYSFPQLGACSDALSPLTPENSTIAFDGASLIADELNPDFMPYQVVASQSYLIRKDGKEVNKATLQAAITTATNNALSWLFGTGLTIWKKESVGKLCADYSVPKSHQYCVERVKEWAEAIPKDALYGSESYAKYRSLVGGKLDSWIANYSKRLIELDKILSEFDVNNILLPDGLFDADVQHLFSGSALNANELKGLINVMSESRNNCQSALTLLLGQSTHLPSADDIAVFEQFGAIVNEFIGEIESLNNRIKQDIEKLSDVERKEKIASLEVKKISGLKELPKVPRLSGGVPNYIQEVENTFERYQSLKKDFFTQVKELTFEKTWDDIVQATILSEEKRYKDHPKHDELDFDSLGYRRLLSKYFSLTKKINVDFKYRVIERILNAGISVYYSDLKDKQKKDKKVQEKDQFIFQEKLRRKNANTLILNEKGRVYVSPYSKGRHAAWALNESALKKINLLEWIEEDLQWFNDLKSTDLVNAYRFELEWLILKNTLLLLALPEKIETSRINQSVFIDIRVPQSLRIQLKEKSISKDQLSKLLNLYVSELRGCCSVIFRERFFLRTRFAKIGDNKIHYVPKINADGEWAWKVPEQVLRTEKPIIDHIHAFLDTNNMVQMGSLKSAAKAVKNEWGRATDFSRILREMPHDWYLNLGIDSSHNFSTLIASAMTKTGLGKPLEIKQACRLIGSPKYKGFLDKQLVGKDLNIGDYTLIIEQHFTQSVTFDGDRIKPVMTPDLSIGDKGLKLEVALPLTQQPLTPEKLIDFNQTYIGIDLGEVGIGYAVVDAKTHQVISKGSIAIRSIRLLINAVKHHRKNKQPRQKFSQRFDTSLLELRENVVGDVCHVINSLMAHYKGVPILESTVGNLASGGKQLQLVYDKVLNRYLYSQMEAHKTARTHFWCGSDNWEHRFAKETIKKYGTEKIETRNLKLFPGSSVHPAGTSQRCSCCGENPHQLIKKAYEELGKGARLSTDENGLLTLNIGEQTVTLKFVRQFMDEKDWSTLSDEKRNQLNFEYRQLKRQNERAPFQYAVKNKSFNFDEAKRQLSRQLRRAPKSTRSKDTSQSQYFCALNDCGFHMHADVNAAINIVYKWIHDRKITN